MKQFLRKLSHSQPEEPLPRSWISLTFLLGVAAFAWGWHLGDWGFFQNILASLVLLGPGLLATNVLAVKWRRQRDTTREGERIRRALNSTFHVIAPICGLVINLAKSVSPRVPEEYRLPALRESITLAELIELLHQSEHLLMLVPFGEDLEPGPYLPSSLRIPHKSINEFSRQIQLALTRLSMVREFPQIKADGEELLDAMGEPLPCTNDASTTDSRGVLLRIVNNDILHESTYSLQGARSGDTISVQRDALITWTAAVLYPLRNLMREITIHDRRAESGILEEEFTVFSNYRLDHRWIDTRRRPRK